MAIAHHIPAMVQGRPAPVAPLVGDSRDMQIRYWESNGTPISPDLARAIAAEYMSPGPHGRAFAMFAQSSKLDSGKLLAAINREICALLSDDDNMTDHGDPTLEIIRDLKDLYALAAYVLACPWQCQTVQ